MSDAIEGKTIRLREIKAAMRIRAMEIASSRKKLTIAEVRWVEITVGKTQVPHTKGSSNRTRRLPPMELNVVDRIDGANVN